MEDDYWYISFNATVVKCMSIKQKSVQEWEKQPGKKVKPKTILRNCANVDIHAMKDSEWHQSIILLAVVAAPTSTTHHNVCLRRGFHCAAARLKDESKSDTSGYREHYQTHSAKQDTAAASQDDSTSFTSAEEAARPNTRLVKKKRVMVTQCCIAWACNCNRKLIG